ncbi:MAG: right-handed parallel beta-helix repeat-containing protein [Kiritimatiellae bacterium]|nr:right-handed parallel beta-helix repeat-containing protein [Kiritimatiellia bacterium]
MKYSILGVMALVGSVVLGQNVRELVVAPGVETPHGALAKIRAAKAAGDKSAWTVRVKPGIYVLDETLTFTPADSGEPQAPVSWVGEEGASVIAGGEPLTNWKDEGAGVWSAPLPKRKDGRPAFFEQLWVNGRRAARARLPDTGFVVMKKPTCAASPDGKPNSFIEKFVIDAALGNKLAQVSAAELPFAQACIVRKWTFARRILRGYEAATQTVTTMSPAAWPGYARWDEQGGTLVWFENVRSAFDAAGEWFYDAQAQKVLYRPLPGEDMSKTLVLAPTKGLSQLLVLKGDPAKGAYVHDINFSGLTFVCTATKTLVTDVLRAATKDAYVPPTEGPTESWQYQAAQSADASVMGEGVKRVVWNRCAVRQTSNYAFRLEDGCFENQILNSKLEDLGAGGVWLGARKGYVPPNEGDRLARRVYRTFAPQANAKNVISNCVIRQAGRINPEGTGVAVTHASDCKVVKCDIVDILYTGVSVGWTWGFAGSVAQRNEIAYNRIANLGQGLMSDMGGVYTLGTSYGTWVHDNVIHDVKSYSYGGWALYTDEGSEGLVMERNLCWNTTDGGFHQHYGTGCVIRNNIFAWNRMAGAVRTSRPEVQHIPCTFHFHNNIVLVREGPLASWDILNVGGVWANNVWFDVSGRPKFSHNLDWAKWCATGHEVNGIYADPQFVDAAKFDFRLKPESPAFKVGFKAWDYGAAGAVQ